ncbi:MAG: NAD(+)--rifampin ADP-ribosyltransferase [Corynebacterium sp.]|uniref:NAD(+)--rifampin ADP-ribosyltransferase n=1 Tax=unclassified Corynebacterium TaxID=2624378 RepID=UPI0009671DAD|nr:NAD(+)--rifampin ADP-ribosyltransferase [Corynebacterium sp. CNJ-954]OLT54981.1 ribosomal subunit interface protein [Corynebacterium sp. CNJ-954]
MNQASPQVNGPFFHGTRAALPVGDLLRAGHPSNYRPEIIMNHIYFTAMKDGAGLAAEIAVMLGGADREPHVYVVAPTGPFEDDPNVTDKKFPGNPTLSFRTSSPLKIVEEITDWPRLSAEALDIWRTRLTAMRDSSAEIIN